MAVTSLPLPQFLQKEWDWAQHYFISPAEETNKNWVLFPEKIHGQFAILHALSPRIMVAYADSLEEFERHPIKSNNQRTGRAGMWDSFVRGAGAPPIKTPFGWLLFYHGTNHDQGVGYRIGAMLLDTDDPTKVLYRSHEPLLSPETPYENDWKAGVIYASGAVVKDGMLFLYYGGGDKTVNSAKVPLEKFLSEFMIPENRDSDKPV